MTVWFKGAARRLTARRLGAVLLLMLAQGGLVHASGDVPYDRFVPRYGSDVEADRYDAGELGVLLPSYGRVFLYPAWRAIVLGSRGLQAAPAQGLGGILAGDSPQGWVAAVPGDPNDTVAQTWLKLSGPYAAPGRAAPQQGMRRAAEEYSEYVICPDAAFGFAAQTLDTIAKRPDATPERLRAWVQGQDKVFALCNAKEGVRPAAQAYPPALPAGETSFFWLQLREYQIASAAFYNEDFEESARRFEVIGANPRNPMHVWGAYLALRSKARAADLDRTPDRERKLVRAGFRKEDEAGRSNPANAAPAAQISAQRQAVMDALDRKLEQRRAAQLADMEARVTRILADAGLAPVHEAARGTLRTMQARLAPGARFETLSAELDDLTRDPYQASRLNDWRMLADGLIGDSGDRSVETQARSRYPFFDWIRTLQNCGQPTTMATQGEAPGGARKESTAERAARERCRAEAAHALAMWRGATPTAALAATPTATLATTPTTTPTATPVAKPDLAAPDPRRAWLVAAMMIAVELPPELESAALAVPAGASEYLTLRYNLARLYRMQGRVREAREIADRELPALRKEGRASMAALNLFSQERFAVAANVNEAAALLARVPSFALGSAAARYDGDSPVARMPRPAGDGVRWLNGQLGTAELFALTADTRLDAATRAQAGVSAWLRADLLNQRELAARAAAWVAANVPKLKDAAARYLAEGTPAKRRHALVLAMLDYQLHPYASSGRVEPKMEWLRQPSREDVTASMWCRITEDDYAFDDGIGGGVEQLPPPLRVSGDAAARDRDIRTLARIKTATGFVGEHVMAHAAAHPRDPDVPWLLHVVVMSTRGGCLDADSSKLSRAAWQLLHRRYKASEWADKTPYWY